MTMPNKARRTFLGAATALAALAAGAARTRPGALGPGRTALAKPGPMLPPVPAVLCTVNGMPGDPDEIAVLWSFVVNGDPAQVGVSAARRHVAGPLIDHHREFVLNVPVAGIVEAFDRVDMSSHRVGDKFALAGLTRGRATAVAAPTVEECPIHLECRVLQAIDLPPERRVFLAEVVATTALAGAVDGAGRLSVPAVPFFGMTAGSGEFYTMGERVGHIGMTAGRDDIRY